MRILLLLGFSLAAMACGGGGGTRPDAAGDPPIDAAIDAPSTACQPTAAPTVPASGPSGCNPLAQTGCSAGQKCAWLQQGPNGTSSCVPDGKVALDCAC